MFGSGAEAVYRVALRGAEGKCGAAIANGMFTSGIASRHGGGWRLRPQPRFSFHSVVVLHRLGRRTWRSGVPCRLLSFREGVGSERCHLISVWRELADLACFSIAKLEREVHDGKGI